MALPVETDIAKLDFQMLGEPCCIVPAKSTIDTTTMDFAYLGEPWVVNPFGAAAAINQMGLML